MATEQDGTVDVPVCDCDSPDQENVDMSNPVPTDPTVAEMMRTHALNGAQAASDSARLFAETLRLDHLEQRRVTDAQEALASRTMSGPHMYYGSPDGTPR
jgi:hypothetical protein